MKVAAAILSLFCLAALSHADSKMTIEEAVALLETVPAELFLDYLPAEGRKYYNNKRSLEGSQHWCCKVDDGIPVPELSSRQVVVYEKATLAVTTGYHSCGTWGTGRCAQTSVRYHQEIKYVMRYMINPQFVDCPKQHVHCCASYIKVNGNCMHHTLVTDHANTILDLQGLGIIPTNDHEANRQG